MLHLPATTAAEGATVRGSGGDLATFADTVHDAANNYTAQLDWGDGTIVVTASVGLVSDGLYHVAGSHAYQKPGVFFLKVTLYDGPVGGASTSSATSTSDAITVTPVNDAPTGVNDDLGKIYEDSGPHPIAFGALLFNDSAGPAGESDEDAQTLTVTGVSNAVGGTAVVAGGFVTFTPTPDFSGNAQFTYTLQDNGVDNTTPHPLTATALATLTVGAVNDPPVASDDVLVSVGEDSAPRTVDKSQLLSNDTTGPANEIAQSLSITAVSNPIGGTVEYNGGLPRFTPAADFNGLAGFTYTITDNGQTNGLNDPKSATARVFFLVTPVNDVPVAVDDSLPSINGVPPQIFPAATLLSNDSKGPADEAAQTLTITAVSNAVGGTVTIVGGDAVFTATPGFAGAASFTYTVTDNGATNSIADPKSASAAVHFDVVPPPTVTSQFLFDAALPILTTTFSPNATNVNSAAFQLFRDVAGAPTPVTDIAYTYSEPDHTLNAVFAGQGNIFPDGEYHLTIASTAATSPLGDAMLTSYSYDFFALAGDANRDRKVNFDDLVILAQNYNQAGRTFSEGNFDYSAGGGVDFPDLVIVAQKYNSALGTIDALLAPTPPGRTTKPRRPSVGSLLDASVVV